jgi:beta-glucosidase
MLKRIGLSALVIVLMAAAAALADDGDRGVPLYLDPSQPIDARVDDLLSRMTADEKITLIHANSKFTTAAIPRLRIPVRWMSDGPHGVREDIGPDTWNPMEHTDDFSTAMPCGSALAATWDTDLATAEGRVIGSEARARGKQIMLGPAINIQRTPLDGRNFEYMGEDPFLTGKMAAAYIRGVQSQQVASCVKHFAANNQEADRMRIDARIDERTLREIYLPGFRAAVQEGGALAVMAAYNKVNGQFCSENELLLNKILKGEWGFKGLVMTDWGAAHSTAGMALNGLDLEMGTNKPYDQFYLAGPFMEGLRDGTYPMSLLDEKARRNLYVYFATGAMDGIRPGELNTKSHQDAARHVEEEAIVLLKNEGDLLPLDPAKVKSIAVIGRNATLELTHGGQSSGLKAFYEISPLDGIIKRAGRSANITYALGYSPLREPRPGQDNPPRDAAGKPAADAAELIDRAVAAARAADVAIVFAGNDHSTTGDTEGSDRPSMALPYGQDELIRRVIDANPRTIVVLVAGSPVEMPWVNQSPAVVQAWFGGMEAGNAIARVLFGDVNPSGKLPCTFPKRLADSPAHAMGNYPGTDGEENYAEGLLVGYRWYDTKAIEPLFPFGHGLSYTKFDYAGLQIVAGGDSGGGPALTVTFALTNTGTRAGAEVAQVYVHQAAPSLPRPDKELKGFAKVSLNPGESKTVSIPLNRSALEYYDPARQGWVAEQGTFTLEVGSSSRDIRLKGDFQLNQTTVDKP